MGGWNVCSLPSRKCHYAQTPAPALPRLGKTRGCTRQKRCCPCLLRLCHSAAHYLDATAAPLSPIALHARALLSRSHHTLPSPVTWGTAFCRQLLLPVHLMATLTILHAVVRAADWATSRRLRCGLAGTATPTSNTLPARHAAVQQSGSGNYLADAWRAQKARKTSPRFSQAGLPLNLPTGRVLVSSTTIVNG